MTPYREEVLVFVGSQTESLPFLKMQQKAQFVCHFSSGNLEMTEEASNNQGVYSCGLSAVKEDG